MKKTAQILLPLALSALLTTGMWGCSKESPAPAPQPPAASAVADNVDFTITQEVSGPYVAGQPLIVKTTMNYQGAEPVTALALQMKLPQAWRYGGTRGELKPAIDPPQGATQEATLIWIQIPSFPATVEYALEVPEWTEGTHTLSARAIYRTLGDELKSPNHELPLSAAP